MTSTTINNIRNQMAIRFKAQFERELSGSKGRGKNENTENWIHN